MDIKALSVCVVIIALVVAAPVAAQDGMPPAYNTAGVQSGELPAPLPRTPGVINMPALELPEIDRSRWPSLVEQRAELDTKGRSALSGVRSELSQRYSEALAQVDDVRTTVGEWRSFVGMTEGGMESITAQSASRSFTMASVAQEMGASIEFSVGYLRAITGLGPLGLDLAFVFVGLAWVWFVNLSIMAIKLTAYLIRSLFNILDFFIRLVTAIFSALHALLQAIDIIWPF